MRIVYMGTPAFSATILEHLIEQHEVVAVYTRPDAVRGRGSKLVPSEVRKMAERFDIPVYTPTTLRDPEVQAELAALEPEVICVAAYGMLLPPEVLEMPPFGCLNVHASLLPRWRGAAPIERAILADDDHLGVCVMKMAEGMDTGDYCVNRSMETTDHLDVEELRAELADLGAQALLTALHHLEDGQIRWTVQDEALVTNADKIGQHELDIVADDSASLAHRKVRASSDSHPSRLVIGGRELALLKVTEVKPDDPLYDQLNDMEQGQVRFACKRLILKMPEGFLEVLSCRPASKKAMDAKAFAAGIQNIKSGSVTWSTIDGA